jgi:hypothetical protein
MRNAFAIAAAAIMAWVAINLPATPADVGSVDDLIKGLSGVTTIDLGSRL